MVRALVEDAVELLCIGIFLAGLAALASHGLAHWMG